MSKKLVSLLLALLMTLSLAFGAAAEEPAAKDPRSFSEHLMTYLTSLDLRGEDLQAVLTIPAGMFTALISLTEEGGIGRVYNADGLLVAGEVDRKALYISDGKTTYGVTYETLKKLAESLSSQFTTNGITAEQIQADAQTVMGWLQPLGAGFATVYSKETVSENEYRVTVNAPAFAQLFTDWLDGVLNGEEFPVIWDRYAKIASQAPSAADITAAWAAQKDQVAALISQAEASVTVLKEENGVRYGLNALIPAPNGKMNLVATIARSTDESTRVTTTQIDAAMAAAGAEDTKLATLVVAHAQSMSGQTVHAEANVNGQQLVVDGAYTMNLLNGTVTVNELAVLNGETIQKTEGTLNLFRQTFELTEEVNQGSLKGKLHCAFDGVKFTMDIEKDGEPFFAAEAWGEEADSNNYVLHAVLTYQGQTQQIDLKASFVPMDPEKAALPEVLQLGVYNGEIPLAVLQLGAAEKTAEPAPSEGEVTWLNENMLMMMFGSMIGGPAMPAAPVPAVAE